MHQEEKRKLIAFFKENPERIDEYIEEFKQRTPGSRTPLAERNRVATPSPPGGSTPPLLAGQHRSFQAKPSPLVFSAWTPENASKCRVAERSGSSQKDRIAALDAYTDRLARQQVLGNFSS